MRYPPFILCSYGWSFWLPALAAGAVITAFLLLVPGGWPFALACAVLTLAVLAFYRDFPRTIPAAPDLMVAPADGCVTEITRLDHFAPFNAPALRLGIFLSVLDVHVNRAPLAGIVLSTEYREGLFLDARHVDSGPKNQSNLIVLGAPATRRPCAAVKQIVGAIARRIIAPIAPGEALARGERCGMIAFGSRTELYVPLADNWEPAVQLGQHVRAGRDIVLRRTA